MVSSELTVTQLSEAVVASQTFANVFNGGTLLNPNAPVTAGIVETLYTEALGHAPTQSTLAQWLNSGLSIAQAFDAMVTSQSYLYTTLPSIEQYLTTAASSVIGAAATNASNPAGDLPAAQVNGIYEAVLQRAPSSVEVTAALALQFGNRRCRNRRSHRRLGRGDHQRLSDFAIVRVGVRQSTAGGHLSFHGAVSTECLSAVFRHRRFADICQYL